MDIISFQKQQLPASFAAIKLIGIILEIFCSAIRINPANTTSNIASTFIFCSLRDSKANYCQSPALSSDHCLHFSPLLRVLNVICRKHWQRQIAVSCLDNFVWCPIHALTNNSRSNPVNRKALHVKQVFAHNITLKKCPPKWANWKQGCLPWQLRVYSATSSQWRSGVKVTVVSIKGNCHRQKLHSIVLMGVSSRS